MKSILKSIWTGTAALSIFVMLVLASPAMAEDTGITEEPQTFNEEQLAQMLAPIALYPDELIAQVLLASTYPLEIVMADRWVQQNKSLQGQELADALEQESWDPSVKALVNFPTVLGMLSQKLDLTTKLGDAFLEQKEEVMDTIQELRKKAADAGNLKSTREQKVVVEDDAITIEPADSRIIYVPTYDPFIVYGPVVVPRLPSLLFLFPSLSWSGFFLWHRRNARSAMGVCLGRVGLVQQHYLHQHQPEPHPQQIYRQIPLHPALREAWAAGQKRSGPVVA